MARFQQRQMRQIGQEQPSGAPIVAGIGESRTFNDPDPANQIGPFDHIRGCHMGGKPVEEVVPSTAAHLITFDHTDEGIAARNEERAESTARVSDRMDHVVDDVERHYENARDMDPGAYPDLKAELVEKYVKPGQRARFLSDPVMKIKGKRGFEFVKDEEGHDVKLGTSTLAVIPEGEARRRERRLQDLNRSIETDHAEKFVEEQERFIRDSGATEVRPLRPGETIRGQYTTVEDRRGTRHAAPASVPRGARIGLQSVRGNSQELEE